MKIIILGAGQVGGNLAASLVAENNDIFQTRVCTFDMLPGRLELMTLFVLFTRTFWRA